MPVMQFLTTCQFDHGALSSLAGHLKKQAIARPFIVTDPGIKAAGLLDLVIAALGVAPAGVFSETEPNPPEEQAEHAAGLFKASGADGIVALGGGSSMDMGKAVGLMATHEAPWDRFGASQKGTRLIGPIPPLIAIPTTAGTGSEVSVGAVLVLRSGRKETFISNHLIPKLALCDPELTLGLPAGLTAATGMDAMVHCIEAVLSPMVNPPAEAIGLDGVERGIGNGWLEAAVKDGADREARWQMMMASYEGALAFVKGLGSVHALSHAAGRLPGLKLHHGTLNAIWLPHVMAFNSGSADDKYDRLRRAMKLKPGADLAVALADLNARLGIPDRLGPLGVTAAMGDEVVRYALSDLAHFTNPRKTSRADYEHLFEAVL
jgi:alcohol dehydrogenase class IV